MTDPTPDELLEDAARAVKDEPPEAIPDAAGLPAEVRDGRIDEAPDEPTLEKGV